ncbi:MAG: hypothetical protein M0Q13_01540 [Methanothrix sp.]|nr:hypothetical protein [Methanothrix sp.]
MSLRPALYSCGCACPPGPAAAVAAHGRRSARGRGRGGQPGPCAIEQKAGDTVGLIKALAIDSAYIS